MRVKLTAVVGVAMAAGAVAPVPATGEAVTPAPGTAPQPSTERPCRSAYDIGPAPNPADAVFIMARGVTCGGARQAAKAWAQGQPDPDGIVVAPPWRCRHAGDRIRCVKPGAAVSFAYAHVRRGPYPPPRPPRPYSGRCADVSVGSAGPAGQAAARHIRVENFGCDEAWRLARHVLCHDGRLPRGWKAIGAHGGGASRGRRAVRWRLTAVTDGSGCP